jgi:hypothetical protein
MSSFRTVIFVPAHVKAPPFWRCSPFESSFACDDEYAEWAVPFGKFYINSPAKWRVSISKLAMRRTLSELNASTRRYFSESSEANSAGVNYGNSDVNACNMFRKNSSGIAKLFSRSSRAANLKFCSYGKIYRNYPFN